MSTYIYFYARRRDTFIPLTEGSRNSKLFEITSHRVSFNEKIVPYSAKNRLLDISTLKEEIVRTEKIIRENEKLTDKIILMNNKIDEKVMMLNDIEDENKALREEIAEIENTIARLYFINEIDVNIDIANDDERDNIYMGIETGYDITVDDIFEGT